MTTFKASLLAVLLGVSTLAAAASSTHAFRVSSPGVRGAVTAPSSEVAAANPANTVLLLHLDGPTFFDSSPSQKAVTNYGSVTVRAASRFGAGALGVPNGSSGLVVAGSTDFAFPAGTDFTVEAQVYTTSASLQQIVGQWTSMNAWQLSLNQGRPGWVTPAGNWTPMAAQALPVNTWHHVAVARQGATMRMFVNGVLTGQATDNINYPFYAAGGLGIGKVSGQNGYGIAGGAVDEVRITKGEALYTANFTPPTAAFTR